MDFQDHFIFALACGQFYLKYHDNFVNIVLFYFLSFFFASFPDVDLAFERFKIKALKHRFLFHSLLFYFFIYLILFFIFDGYFILNFIFIIIFSHIILDVFGKKGVNLFYPIINKFYRIDAPKIVVRIATILFFIFSSMFFYR